MTGPALAFTATFHLVVPVIAVLASGCSGLSFIWDREDREIVDLGLREEDLAGSDSASHRNTIGELTFYQGTGPLKVRGYGLVLGLGEMGSRDCPSHVYKELVQSMYRQHSFTEAQVGVKSMTPEELISSIDTAAVSVQAEIPAGSVSGTPIDVVVRTLPGTQTKSLAGGHLFPMELEVFRDVPERGSISGRALARAAGPIFINPFADGESATPNNPREGIILGGAVTTSDRDVRLVLIDPSYQRAKRIQDRINSRFPGNMRLADAVSPSFIRVNIPPEFYADSGHFLSLIRSLYLSRDPQFEAIKIKKLAKEMNYPAAPHAKIALCFEGIGENSVPTLRELYSHERDSVSFHAAAAGIRLNEHLAVDIMAKHALDTTSEFRYQAIRALAVAKSSGGAALTLRRLLEDEDPRVNVAAYEALLERKDASIHSLRVGKNSFRLDILPTSRSSTIYCKRAGSQRIALFGNDLNLKPPFFYGAPDGSLVLNADQTAESVAAIRTSVNSGRTSPVLQLPLALPDFIRLCGNNAGVDIDDNITGLGLGYGAIVRALHHLCQDGAISARFMLEQPNVNEMFGPARRAGRPESDL
ncbi:MAG: flagellar basal body P-ring protein FlgI [Planctomycetota bacterium]|jgi:flagellar basal body P-ring protein FlgI